MLRTLPFSDLWVITRGAPILNLSVAINSLAGLNYSVNKGYFTIQNDGGGTLQWTATSQTPNLITMDTPTGQTTTQGTIAFTLNVGSLPPGDYVGAIYVDAGTAGTAWVTVNVKVVSILGTVHKRKKTGARNTFSNCYLTRDKNMQFWAAFFIVQSPHTRYDSPNRDIFYCSETEGREFVQETVKVIFLKTGPCLMDF